MFVCFVSVFFFKPNLFVFCVGLEVFVATQDPHPWRREGAEVAARQEQGQVALPGGWNLVHFQRSERNLSLGGNLPICFIF